MKNCGNCRFWLDQNGVNGLCRRNPPVPVFVPEKGDRTENVVTFFPSMQLDGWCGEHKLAPPTKKDS